jgi:hypothetical protein
VFSEKTDIYFARQQVSERLLELRRTCRPVSIRSWGLSPPASVKSATVDRLCAHGSRCRCLRHARRGTTDYRSRAPRIVHRAGLDSPAVDQECRGRQVSIPSAATLAIPGPARPFQLISLGRLRRCRRATSQQRQSRR